MALQPRIGLVAVPLPDGSNLVARQQHGLRRSFGTLSEWIEVPVGVVAQIQGHKPSALAEKHYRRRPLDMLRMWHDKIKAWMLEQAGVKYGPLPPQPRHPHRTMDNASN